jgi:hypothetical protein
MAISKINRQREIDAENSHLLKKMLDIIQRKNESIREMSFVPGVGYVAI